jgi:hypothetical protein
VRWSSPHALADTLANLADRSVAFVATLADVDDAEDLTTSTAHFGRRVPPYASASFVVPPPLVGVGQGGGDCRELAIGVPPTPSPSPRRVGDAPSARWGGESVAQAGGDVSCSAGTGHGRSGSGRGAPR